MNEQNERSDWDDRTDVGDPILMSEFEHKGFLISPARTLNTRRPGSFASKELTLSVLDSELSFIYGIKQICAEEWANLGFHNLAERRDTHAKIKLGIRRSVGGIERFLQTATASASTDLQAMNNQTTTDKTVEQKTGHNINSWKNWFK